MNRSAGFGLIAPAGTPPDIIRKLNETFVAAMNDPVVKERIYSERGRGAADHAAGIRRLHQERNR